MSRRRRQHGFTLVEIMVSLVISSLLIGMILSVFSRMSMAYRGQQGVAELQQILAAGQSMIERDLRQAGRQLPEGFFIGNDSLLHQPIEILNDADGLGSDQLHVYYADASAQARVMSFNSTATLDAFESFEVDDPDGFVAGDLVVLTRSPDPFPTTLPRRFNACVVQVEVINGTSFQVDGAGTWGTALNSHCNEIRTNTGSGSAMVYRFRARGYRIDPTRRQLAVLQMSPTAGYLDDWQDLAAGFTDLQVASRWDDTDYLAGVNVDTVDLDTDVLREWFSDATQTNRSAPLPMKSTASPGDVHKLASYETTDRSQIVGLRVTLVVRTRSKIDTVPSQRTPKLIDDARPGNNDLGDRDEILLEGVADSARPLELRGDHIYRYATVGTDLRNLGVGR